MEGLPSIALTAGPLASSLSVLTTFQPSGAKPEKYFEAIMPIRPSDARQAAYTLPPRGREMGEL